MFRREIIFYQVLVLFFLAGFCSIGYYVFVHFFRTEIKLNLPDDIFDDFDLTKRVKVILDGKGKRFHEPLSLPFFPEIDGLSSEKYGFLSAKQFCEEHELILPKQVVQFPVNETINYWIDVENMTVSDDPGLQIALENFRILDSFKNTIVSVNYNKYTAYGPYCMYIDRENDPNLDFQKAFLMNHQVIFVIFEKNSDEILSLYAKTILLTIKIEFKS